MFPDILGYSVEEGISLLHRNGISDEEIIVNDYFSPKHDVIGDDRRILRITKHQDKIILIVGSF